MVPGQTGLTVIGGVTGARRDALRLGRISRRSQLRGRRYDQLERGAVAAGAVHPDRAVVGFGDGLRNRQAEPESAGFPAAVRLGAGETAEDAVQVGRRDAAAGVGHGDDGLPVVEADADFESVARFGVRDGDARWDLSTTYHAAVLALDPGTEPRPDGSASDDAVARRRGRLHDLIDGTEYQPLIELSSGPYWPSATQAGLANPWAIVLAAEGLCAFGGSAVPVYEMRDQPWTAVAGPETSQEDGWGEAWLPMWGRPMAMGEVALLLGGPQPRWRGTGARTPAQMYASLRTVGWPRGITGYARSTLARRRGPGPHRRPARHSGTWVHACRGLAVSQACGRTRRRH